MKKHGYRTNSVIESVDKNIPDWLVDFARRIDKKAVQPYREEKGQSIYDQINNVLNGSKSKFQSVSDAVEDMKQRSGLTSYQNKTSSNNNGQEVSITTMAQQINQAGHSDENDIKIFKLKPQIKDTISNYVEDTHGNLSLPSILEKIKSIHHNDISDDGAWDDDNLLSFINNKNTEAKKKHPNKEESLHLGKLPHFDESDVDPSNADALHSLMPAVIKD